jgi:hypothetical protein
LDAGARRRAIVIGALFVTAVLATFLFFRRQTVEWRWRHYESQVREALSAGDGRDVTEAITFFENATGLTSMASTSESGRRTVVPAVAEELPQWEAWYATHEPCLEWDLFERRLELRKGCGD